MSGLISNGDGMQTEYRGIEATHERGWTRMGINNGWIRCVNSSVSIRGYSFVLDRIAQCAEAVDSDFDDIAVEHETWGRASRADSATCAGENHRASDQSHSADQFGNQICHGEDHLRGVGILHDLAVELRHQSQ